MDTGEKTQDRTSAHLRPTTPGWAPAGWHPLFCENVQAHISNPDILVLTVRVPEGQSELYAKVFKGKIAPMSPIFWRRSSDAERGHYEISALDHSYPGFKELKFEAFKSFETLQGFIRREAIEAQSADFLAHMQTAKSEISSALYVPGLARKLEAIIQASYQKTLQTGELEGAADRTLSELRKCAASELHIVQERERIYALVKWTPDLRQKFKMV